MSHAPFLDVRDMVDVTLDETVQTLPTVVTVVTDEDLVLEAPQDRTGRYVLPPAGMTGLMVWRGAATLEQVPIAIAKVTPPPGPTWHVRIKGSPTKCQRRAFVRADVLLPVVLHHHGSSYDATAVDLSEGGLRCRVRDWPELASRQLLEAELDVGVPLTLAAQVVRLKREALDEPADVSLRFTTARIGDGDRIRQFVFSQLQQARSRGLL
jgi:hypothetical protein